MIAPRQEPQRALFFEVSLEDHIPQDSFLLVSGQRMAVDASLVTARQAIAKQSAGRDESGRNDGAWPQADVEWEADNNRYI